MNLRCRKVCLPSLLLAVVVGGLPAQAAGTKTSGQLELELKIKVNPAIPDGSSASITASAGASDSHYSNSSYASPSAKVQGGMIEMTVPISYDWTVASTSDTVNIYVSISGSSGTYDASSYTNKTIPLPANGAVTKLTFDGAL